MSDRRQVIEDLKAARAELVKRGRSRGYMVRADGQVCAIGAIGVATVADFERLYLDAKNNVSDTGLAKWSYGLASLRCLRARQALRRHVPRDDGFIELFNDDENTTDQDVLNLFDKALADLGGLA